MGKTVDDSFVVGPDECPHMLCHKLTKTESESARDRVGLLRGVSAYGVTNFRGVAESSGLMPGPAAQCTVAD